MTIFDELRNDHDEQRDLIARLVQTVGASDERDELFDRLSAALAAHAAAEERHFYTALMESSLTQEKARHSIHEHAQLDDLVESLEGYDRSAPAWLETARELEHKVTHHLEEEEREVFPMAGKALSEGQKDSLGRSYRAMMIDELNG